MEKNNKHQTEKQTTTLAASLLPKIRSNFDSKKNIALVGVAVVVLGLLFSGGSSANKDILAKSFPVDGSTKEQCAFIGEYERSIFRAAADGVAADDIKGLMNNDMQDHKTLTHSAQKYFYQIKAKSMRKLPNLVKSVDSDKFKAASSSEIEEKINKKGRRYEAECLMAFDKS